MYLFIDKYICPDETIKNMVTFNNLKIYGL